MCEKDKLWRGANPGPTVLKASAVPLLHAYVDVWERQSAGWRQTADIGLINWNASPTSTCEKDKLWRSANPGPMVLKASALPLLHAYVDVWERQSAGWRQTADIGLINWNASPTSTCEKEKGLARREPTTYGFERQRPTSTPLRPVAQAFKTIGRGFTPRQPFVFFTRRRRRRVSIYQSYYRREETKYNRSEWCRG